MNLSSIMALFSFLVGMVVGSFINVCIYRIPQKKSILYPPSSCPNCGERIRFYDNIPILSYILLWGKCRFCRKPIPSHYPLVETLMAVFSLSLFIRFGPTYQYAFFFVFIGSLLAISFIDLYHQIIPDVLSIPGIVIGFGISFFSVNIRWPESGIGILAGGGILWLIAWIYERVTGKQGMGGGDIKLLAMIGAWMGWRSLLFIVLLSSLSGTIIGGTALFFLGKGYRVRIPFGPFLALGTLIYLFFGPRIMAWYSRLAW